MGKGPRSGGSLAGVLLPVASSCAGNGTMGSASREWWGFDVWTSETYGPLQWSVASKKRNASGGAGNDIHRPYSKGPLLVVIAVLGDT